MGRHRRSAADPAPAEPAAGPDGRPRGGSRRRKRAAAPVRTGLLGVSAAVAVGAVAVASGLLPGGGTYKVSGDTMTGPPGAGEPHPRRTAAGQRVGEADFVEDRMPSVLDAQQSYDVTRGTR
ncbi:hypothetical protein SXANM310S_01301 [Streptomyces xanthochromogenes]